MAYEKKANSGSLFQNDRKQNENHADYNGSVMVGGVEYWLNGWKKTTKDGKPWLSLALKPKDAAKQQRNSYDEPAPDCDDNGEIPF